MPIPLASLLQDSAPTQAPPPALPSIFSSQLFPLLIIAVLFFVLLILPERKKQKERQKMLDALKKGDRVLTTSGIYGTVVTTTAEVAVLQVADNVRLRFSRAGIQSVIEASKEPALEEKAEPTKV
jgi:preprotein translocase subunit YajC